MKEKFDAVALIITGVLGILLSLFFTFFIITGWHEITEHRFVIIITIIFMSIGVSSFMIGYKNIKKIRTKKDELFIWKTQKYPELLQTYNVPKKSKTIIMFNKECYVYVFDNALCFFPIISECKKFEDNDKYGSILHSQLNSYFMIERIKLDNIECFYPNGELYREHVLSGGGGGGSSISGAIVGGVLFGGVGAIVGSRNKSNPIKSELITHDSREVIFTYYQDNQFKELILKHNDYKTLFELIPEKSYEVICEVRKQKVVQSSITNTKSIPEQIQELAKLKDSGILTVQEFDYKKNELLARM
jgi:hypothetical protein